jgi:Flp pilus assembly protein TadB
MTSSAWALLAAALLVLPVGAVRGARRPGRHGSRPVGRARRHDAALPAIAAAASGIAGLAVGGLRVGAFVALGCAPVAVLSVRWLQRRPVRLAPDRSLALVLDMAAAALRSGRPLADALARAAPAGRPEVSAALEQVAGLSRLGADPAQAWAALPRDGPLGDLAAIGVRSAASGIKMATALERFAAEIRAERSAAALVRAHRAGVAAMAPLAACFLPSFVCLGVVPTVVGIAKSAVVVLL